MAMAEKIVWDIRTTGDSSNGGGFDDALGGTDYSQQDVAELTITDLVSDVTGTEISSVTGGFTEAMEGNVIHIQATGAFVAHWYELVTYTDANTFTIDRSCGASKSGGEGKVGGAHNISQIGGDLIFEFTTTYMGRGPRYYLKSGSHSFYAAASMTNLNGSDGTLPVIVEGYKLVHGDQPLGDDRPLLTGSYSLSVTEMYTRIGHIRTLSPTTASMISGSSATTRYYYCKFQGNGGPNSYPISCSNAFLYCCEFLNPGIGVGRYLTAGAAQYFNCYFRESDNGPTSGGHFNACIFANMTGSGVKLSGGNSVIGCTIWNCGIGIDYSSTGGCIVIDNIIAGCAIGSQYDEAFETAGVQDFNCWYNTVDFANTAVGLNGILADPKLNDPDNGDFTLQAGSPCFDIGMQQGADVTGVA